MEKKEAIKYWIDSSKQDFAAAEILYKNKKHHHALFFCHLAIEKLLKALIINSTAASPPLIHNLSRLAEKANIQLPGLLANDLSEISTFNIEARYDDYKLSFYKRANKKFAGEYLIKTKTILKWLEKQI